MDDGHSDSGGMKVGWFHRNHVLLTVVSGILGAVFAFAFAVAVEYRTTLSAQATATMSVIDRAMEIAFEIGLEQQPVEEKGQRYTSTGKFREELSRLRFMAYVGEHRVKPAQSCVLQMMDDLLTLSEGALPGYEKQGDGIPVPPYLTVVEQGSIHKQKILAWRDHYRAWGRAWWPLNGLFDPSDSERFRYCASSASD